MKTKTENQRLVKDLNGTREFAIGLATELASRFKGQSDKRTLILLQGSMGAGKTQLTRFFLEALGSAEVASPSFAIHHRYQVTEGNVDHFDLFRLESEEDLESTGFWDLFLESSGIVIVEWAERLTELGLENQLPRQWRKIKISMDRVSVDSDERRISLEEWI